MTALPQILAMVVPIALFAVLAGRELPVVVRRVVLLGAVAAWLYAAFEAVVLALFALSPSGIGADNWPELVVAAGVVVGLPLWLAVGRGRQPG